MNEVNKNLQLTGANYRGDRRELDFYPTPENVTIALLKFLKLPLHFEIWEPACGNYKMSKVIERQGYIVKATDIIYGNDFLTTEGYADAIITNPPFFLSEKFIEKSLTEAPIVAMLLKSQYWHAKKHFDIFNKNPPAYVLPLTWRPDFYEDEPNKTGSPTMEMAWTVWDATKTWYGTIYQPLLKPEL